MQELDQSVRNEARHPYPTRARFARRAIQAYRLGRGRDRLYLVLRKALAIPRLVTVDLTSEIEINLDLDDYLQRWIFCHGLSEELDFSLLKRILKPGEHFVDVGANIGVVSLLASRAVGPEGRVYSIEALPETAMYLKENIALNNVDNISVLEYALLGENRDIEIYPSRGGNIGGTSLASKGARSLPIIVPGITFDTLAENGRITKCDVLKMDIEGAELLALDGMTALFTNAPPAVVMIEIDRGLLANFSFSPEDVFRFFSTHGYKWFVAEPNGLAEVNDRYLKSRTNFWAVLPDRVDSRLFTK